MRHQPKGSSRFIPTLTEVVVEPRSPNTSDFSASDTTGAQKQTEAPWDAASLSVSAQAAPIFLHEGFTATPTPAQVPRVPGFEEHVVHRVMQRVDVALDQRLRDAIATVLSEQTRSLLPRLREEVESVVRHVVYEAVADELASGEKKAENGKK